MRAPPTEPPTISVMLRATVRREWVVPSPRIQYGVSWPGHEPFFVELALFLPLVPKTHVNSRQKADSCHCDGEYP